MSDIYANYDSPWKEVLELYFPECMAFFFPEAFADIDWSKKHEFLDTELQQVVRDATTNKRRVDKLVRVWRKNGDETWVLIHIEVQAQPETDFPQRMYIYNYRLFDRYQLPIASFAILTDDNPNWRPTQYVYELWGSRAGLQFPVVKLLDYAEQWVWLEQNLNPFAIVVVAHLKTLETRRKPTMRRKWKLILIQMLYERGYTRQDVLELFRFIDWVMVLPPDLEKQLQVELSHYEEERKMRYVTTIERWAENRGIEQGIEQGLEQGEAKAIRERIMETLEVRFNYLPEPIAAHLKEVNDITLLKALFKLSLTADSLDTFSQQFTQRK